MYLLTYERSYTQNTCNFIIYSSLDEFPIVYDLFKEIKHVRVHDTRCMTGNWTKLLIITHHKNI